MRICPSCETRTEESVCPFDGYKTVILGGPPAEADPMLGAVFEERYRIDEIIARGGFGAVYKGTQLTIDRPVAIKILKADRADDLLSIKRFQQEARAIAGFQHPNIIELFDFGQASDGQFYLVMEYLEGESLAHLMVREVPLDPQRVIRIAIQAAEALAEAHGHGIIHRDLKPENLFVSQKERRPDAIKLLDFGIAKLTEEGIERLTQTGDAIGSPGYMSPEQCEAIEVTPGTDFYSLGCILYELLFARSPYDARTSAAYVLAHLQSDPLPPEIDGRPVEGPLVDLVLDCLEKDPAHRPADAAELLRRLRACAEDPEPVRARRAGSPNRERKADGGHGYEVEFDGDPAPARAAGATTALPGAAQPRSPAPSRRRSRKKGAVSFRRSASVADRLEDPRVRLVVGAGGVLALAGVGWLLFGGGAGDGPADEGEAAAQVEAGASEASGGLTWVELPGGSFGMGSSTGERDERPVHQVALGGFSLMQGEATVAQYRSCMDAGACPRPVMKGNEGWQPGCNFGQPARDDHPMNCVTWLQARAMCTHAGGRLPSEAQWEYAARDAGGSGAWPWGDQKPTCDLAVLRVGSIRGCGLGGTAPGCSKPAGRTARGLCDMAGNVAEWTADWYAPAYAATGLERNPSGPANGSTRVIRGGSFDHSASSLRAAARSGVAPTLISPLIGFRCAR